MSPLSTAQVAAMIGVHRVTLEEWLSKGRIRPPKTIRVGGQMYRLWTERDVKRLAKFKAKFYRKGRGRKKRTQSNNGRAEGDASNAP